MAQDDPQQPTLKILTTVPSNAEAAMVVGELEGAGIQAMQRPGALPGGLWGGPGSCDIYVEQQDLDRVREVINTEARRTHPSRGRSGARLTQPKKGDPIEIPVPNSALSGWPFAPISVQERTPDSALQSE
jgi:hypothetical protein